MPKRNIYVDEDLDAEIRHFDVPLSSVCQAALRDEVDRRRRLEITDEELASIAARLIADRTASDRRLYEEGVLVGKTWAAKSAAWTELQTFVSYRGRRRELVFLEEGHSLRSRLLSLAFEQTDDADPDWYDRLRDTNPFERGVIEGASAVLEAVTPLIEATPNSDE